MASAKCLICGGEREREDCHIIVLSEEERAHVPEPLDEYVYCKPCWKVISDPTAGPSLMSGIASHYLRRIGVSKPEVLDRFKAALTSRAVRPKS